MFPHHATCACNCADAGVLGPVPGILGSLQALLALKIVLNMPGQLGGELLLMDFTNFVTTRLKAGRRAGCDAPGCALIRGGAREDPGIEVTLPSLSAARELQFELIDIRTPEEVAGSPAPARHIAMPALLSNPGLLPAAGRYLLICASGQRSLAAARELRKHGLPAYSLAGGLRSMKG